MKGLRLSRLFKLMKQDKLETIAVNPGASLFYLTGLHFHLMERPVVLFLKPSTTPLIVLPELEIIKIDQSSVPLNSIVYGDDPASWQFAFDKALKLLKINTMTMGIEPTQIRFLEMEFIKNADPGIEFISAKNYFSSLRLHKDKSEIPKIHKAVQIAEAALEAVKPMISIGKSEKEIASELTLQLLKAGSDPLLPFQPIVSSGSNSASPHAIPSDRKLGKGDMLVIDWGAACEGYISDLTRTFAIGEMPQKFKGIAKAVFDANTSGRKAVIPGKALGSIDDAARNVIQNAGFGDNFTHRTGHGIGLESHEEPFLFSSNSGLMVEGMVFTIEPGIYLPGEGGIRIEDDVVVTTEGCEVLSSINRHIEVL